MAIEWRFRMKNSTRKLKFQIFAYMAITFLVWFLISTFVSEFFYYLEEKRGIEFPFKVYLLLTVIEMILLVLMNIPFLRYLIKHVDKPVQKIVSSLNQIADGNYDEKIDFESRNEFEDIKNAFNDMSEKLVEAEKIKQNAENERVLLFANMAHDLKTPITSIIGFSKALSDGIIEDETKRTEYVSTINSKAVRMNELIDRLFEYVKLESAENKLHLETVDVAEILRNCIADVYTEYEEKKIRLELEIPDEAVQKNADRLELSRVYTNLLNNVIKHNKGGINVLVRMDANGQVLIADSGERLSQELSEQLFTPFVSGDSSRRSGGGSGLGLSLAKKIMNKHGGDLKFVQSDAEVPVGYNKGFLVNF